MVTALFTHWKLNVNTVLSITTTGCSAPRNPTQSVTNASNYQFTNLLLQQLPAHYSLSDCPIYSPLVQLRTVPSSSLPPFLIPTQQIKIFLKLLQLIVYRLIMYAQEICDVLLFIVKTGNRLSAQIQSGSHSILTGGKHRLKLVYLVVVVDKGKILW